MSFAAARWGLFLGRGVAWTQTALRPPMRWSSMPALRRKFTESADPAHDLSALSTKEIFTLVANKDLGTEPKQVGEFVV